MTDLVNEEVRPVVGARECHCEYGRDKASPRSVRSIVDDPAAAIALAMAFARICRQRGTEIPAPAVDLLRSHVDEGNAACTMVFAHLHARGLIAVVRPTSLGGGTHDRA